MIERAYLAHKYARALIHHYDWYQRDLDWAERVAAVAAFFHMYRQHFFHAPRHFFEIVFRNAGFEEKDYVTLLTMLEMQHRLLFLPDILQAVVALYQKEKGYEECRVQSAQPLTEQQQRELCASLADQVGKKIYCTYEIDPSLIAGIKVRGQTFVWEDSVAQRLRQLEQRVGAK